MWHKNMIEYVFSSVSYFDKSNGNNLLVYTKNMNAVFGLFELFRRLLVLYIIWQFIVYCVCLKYTTIRVNVSVG
jgi:hypothetical protein